MTLPDTCPKCAAKLDKPEREWADAMDQRGNHYTRDLDSWFVECPCGFEQTENIDPTDDSDWREAFGSDIP